MCCSYSTYPGQCTTGRPYTEARGGVCASLHNFVHKLTATDLDENVRHENRATRERKGGRVRACTPQDRSKDHHRQVRKPKRAVKLPSRRWYIMPIMVETDSISPIPCLALACTPTNRRFFSNAFRTMPPKLHGARGHGPCLRQRTCSRILPENFQGKLVQFPCFMHGPSASPQGLECFADGTPLPLVGAPYCRSRRVALAGRHE